MHSTDFLTNSDIFPMFSNNQNLGIQQLYSSISTQWKEMVESATCSFDTVLRHLLSSATVSWKVVCETLSIKREECRHPCFLINFIGW